MIMKIDFMERKNKPYYQELLTKMVQQNIRDEELLKLTDALKEIDYSEPDQLMTLFDYHDQNMIEKTKTALDVAKEYKEGKLDPYKFKLNKNLRKL